MVVSEENYMRPTGNGTEQRIPGAVPARNLELATVPDPETGECELWVSAPEPMDDSNGEWGFALYMNKDIWLATFSYKSEGAAIIARKCMIPALQGATFVATADS